MQKTANGKSAVESLTRSLQSERDALRRTVSELESKINALGEQLSAEQASSRDKENCILQSRRELAAAQDTTQSRERELSASHETIASKDRDIKALQRDAKAAIEKASLELDELR